MGVLEVGGVRIGEGRPKVIVSIMDDDSQGLMNTYERALDAGADLLEWRADFWPSIHCCDSVAGACHSLSDTFAEHAPYIFTCRTKGQGGQVEMSAGEYEQLLSTVICQGEPGLVDIELGIGDEAVKRLIGLAHDHRVVTIVSHHDFGGTPSTESMTAILLHMVELGADIPKLAVMAHSLQDAENLMQATSSVHERSDLPLVTMAMGEFGRNTRLQGELFGSSMTFCALGRPSAPGQVEIAQAIAAMEAIHRSHTDEQQP